MVGNVASLSLAANLCDDEEDHLREKGKVLRAIRMPPDDAHVNVNADASLARNIPRVDACTAIWWRRMLVQCIY